LWLALISAGSAVLGAFAGALGTIFGPAWVEGRRLSAAEAARREDARSNAVLAFGEALALFAGRNNGSGLKLSDARVRLAAALRPGEGAVSRFADAGRRHVESVASTQGAPAAILLVPEITDTLFAWLRGDIALKEIEELAESFGK
jgi:hypothetical protein